MFVADIAGQSPAAAAEIEELRWVSALDAESLEVAPLARTNLR